MVEEIKLLNDKACKRMLSHKKALAIIIKTLIPEFKDIDLAIIEKVYYWQ